jgi:hypothetical protein
MRNLRKLIRGVLDEVFEEGLISTHSDKAIDILNKEFKSSLESRQNMDNLSIDVFIKNYNYETLVNILSRIENLGYLISKFGIKGYQYVFSNEEFLQRAKESDYKLPIYLKLEAKFDNKKTKIPPILYHVTHERHIEKIKKIGLVPKSKSKKSFHSERIYLFKNKEMAEEIAKEFSKLDYKFEHNYILLEIDSSKISGIKLHVDPNLKDGGFYTYDNIPPLAINFDNMEKISFR